MSSTYEHKNPAVNFVNSIEGIRSMRERDVAAPCLKEVVAGLPLGTDATELLETTVSSCMSETEWQDGEYPGVHAQSLRICPRAACDFVCRATISGERKIVGLDSSWREELEVCVAELAQE